MSNAPQVERVAAVQEGSRWLYSKPDGEQVGEWFGTQTLHGGMTHQKYLSGVVLISSTEKVKETRRRSSDGGFFQVELDIPIFTPYVKVDTRIAYFWDLVRTMNMAADEPDRYVGVIEPVEQLRVTDERSPYYNANLPAGFSWYVVRDSKDRIARYIVCEQRVAIYRRESYAAKLKGEADLPVIAGQDSKQTAVLSRAGWADDFAIMKARTGAIGRALGVAGILTVGTGVATAEDMQEAMSGEAQAGATDDKPVTLPAVQGASASDDLTSEAPTEAVAERTQEEIDAELRTKAQKLRAEMSENHPDTWKAYVEWYTTERRFPPLDELTGSALKGAVTKLERDLDAAKQA